MEKKEKGKFSLSFAAYPCSLIAGAPGGPLELANSLSTVNRPVEIQLGHSLTLVVEQ